MRLRKQITQHLYEITLRPVTSSIHFRVLVLEFLWINLNTFYKNKQTCFFFVFTTKAVWKPLFFPFRVVSSDARRFHDCLLWASARSQPIKRVVIEFKVFTRFFFDGFKRWNKRGWPAKRSESSLANDLSEERERISEELVSTSRAISPRDLLSPTSDPLLIASKNITAQN